MGFELNSQDPEKAASFYDGISTLRIGVIKRWGQPEELMAE